jgi:hypothetical protein
MANQRKPSPPPAISERKKGSGGKRHGAGRKKIRYEDAVVVQFKIERKYTTPTRNFRTFAAFARAAIKEKWEREQ